jgi:putative oxidoreductase
MNVARLAARVTIGGLFVGHGAQKLKGWFGGPGLEGTEGMMESLEMHPPRRNALAAGVTEVAGGSLLALGLATPLACASLIGTMITAIRKVHLPQGPWATEGGYEYNLVLIAALLALAEEGPGDVSLDAALGSERTGVPWGLAALALGAGVSTASIELGRRNAPGDGRHSSAANGSGSTAGSGQGTRESVGSGA